MSVTVMSTLDRPRLRPGLAVLQDESDPRYVFVWDQARFSGQPLRFNVLELAWMQLFDGERTLREIQYDAMRQLNGQLLSLDLFTRLVEKLDQALLLDSPRFRERLSSPVREPSCLGCYANDPETLKRQLERMFIGPGGPGLPAKQRKDHRLRAALLPHIDYGRGGVAYGWGFKEVFEHTDAELFVIIGTSHYSMKRFTLTRKDFKTPLGIAETDQKYIDRLVVHYGEGLFDDELAHLPEHSIELEVVFLQYLYSSFSRSGTRRPLRIVPLVVGPFQDAVDAGTLPKNQDDIARMIDALRLTEAEMAVPVCYIISGDLAHLGPKFGDRQPVSSSTLAQSREQDRLILRQAEGADAPAFFRVIAEEADRRRICGLPPTYTVLEAIRPRSGKVLHYGQYAHPKGFESVSYASVAFYR